MTKNDEISVCGVKITHPNKVVFKDCNISKLQVVKYYKAVGRRMLKYMGNRLISAVRCHEGLSCFYKKHPSGSLVGVEPLLVKDKNGEGEYFYINSVKGLVSEAQLGTTEFHCWASRVETLEQPDIMVFDLDPDVDMDVDTVRQGVKDLRQLLNRLKLKSFLKTSGGKGYHIVVPFRPNVGWEKFSAFAKKVAKTLEQQYPTRYTSNIRKASRKGKIFIDWERNTRAQTSVAPYSLRARAGAKVSMPISWRSLNKIAPADIDIFAALKLIKKPDPWKNFFKVNQTLT